jgi:hypothetical protein
MIIGFNKILSKGLFGNIKRMYSYDPLASLLRPIKPSEKE